MDELRRKIADRVRALSPEERAEGSRRAVENLGIWLERHVSEADTVGLFRPGEGTAWAEADPSGILARTSCAETHFAFPRVLDRFLRIMDFAVPMRPSDWTKGVYGNPEPLPGLPAVDPHAIDVVVVPGVVFGLKGERIGRGGGFYDRFLMSASGALRIAFAYDFQVLSERVPQADWDARMDLIVTDLRVLETFARPAS